jgi:hypothetical protein
MTLSRDHLHTQSLLPTYPACPSSYMMHVLIYLETSACIYTTHANPLSLLHVVLEGKPPSIPSTSVFLVPTRISGSGGSNPCIRSCTTVVSPSCAEEQAECPRQPGAGAIIPVRTRPPTDYAPLPSSRRPAAKTQAREPPFIPRLWRCMNGPGRGHERWACF